MVGFYLIILNYYYMAILKFKLFVNPVNGLPLNHQESFDTGEVVSGFEPLLYSEDVTKEAILYEIDQFLDAGNDRVDPAVAEKYVKFREILDQCEFKESTLTI